MNVCGVMIHLKCCSLINHTDVTFYRDDNTGARSRGTLIGQTIPHPAHSTLFYAIIFYSVKTLTTFWIKKNSTFAQA